VSVAATPELQALQASLLDWAKRAGCLSAVRAAEQSGAVADLSVFDIIDPADTTDSLLVAAAAAEQLAASLAPGPVMPALLAALVPIIGVTGAAIASTIPYAISLVLMLRCLWKLPYETDGGEL